MQKQITVYLLHAMDVGVASLPEGKSLSLYLVQLYNAGKKALHCVLTIVLKDKRTASLKVSAIQLVLDCTFAL